VIDTKHWTEVVDERAETDGRVGDDIVDVNECDATELADALGWQVEAARAAIDDASVPVYAALCYVDADWKLTTRPLRANRVMGAWTKELAKRIATPGPLDQSDVSSDRQPPRRRTPPAVLSA